MVYLSYLKFCYMPLLMFLQTDGASACLVMSEDKALEMGYKPKAYLRYILPYATINCLLVSSIGRVPAGLLCGRSRVQAPARPTLRVLK